MTVKRYDPSIADGDGWEIGDASPCMEECEVGDYVKHDDYAALAARLAEAQDKALRFDLDQLGIEARERDAVELVELRARLAEARANAFQDALDCMRDRQARDHLAACLQDKYGVWWKTDSATYREDDSHD